VAILAHLHFLSEDQHYTTAAQHYSGPTLQRPNTTAAQHYSGQHYTTRPTTLQCSATVINRLMLKSVVSIVCSGQCPLDTILKLTVASVINISCGKALITLLYNVPVHGTMYGYNQPCLGACSAVQCSAVQCSAVQCSAVQCSAVQCSAKAKYCVAAQKGLWNADWRRVPAGSAVQCSVVQCSAVQCSAVQCSAGQGSAVQCSAAQCSAVQCSAGDPACRK
jgi:hypothetical protein